MSIRKSLNLLLLCLLATACADGLHHTVVAFDTDEYWWGGVVALGSKMPYLQPVEAFDLALRNDNNQVVPLFLSSRGRYVWSDTPFTFEVKDNSLHFASAGEPVAVRQAGTTLREAFLAASAAHFPPSGTTPDSLFFTMPQYNTWIELMYDQNQDAILRYAHDVTANGFPTGILMIDDNWQKYYGNFEFKPDKFPDPKAMVAQLHAQGFRVMLWVCPFVSADSPEFRVLKNKGYLLRERGTDTPAMIRWWNGVSACYDFTNPDAAGHFAAQLKALQTEYGIDGFKFDAGDNPFYDPRKVEGYRAGALSVDHSEAWAALGLQFPFNEFRACWKMGGQPLVQRLGDKDYSWEAVRLLIPDMLAAGLLGYAYTCPDMIGGGQFTSFLGIDSDSFDQALIVRSAQVHALMPMMQFSVAPWRILDAEHLAIARQAARLHADMGGYIAACAAHAAATGEPVVRHLEYAFPHEGFARCVDQFMLGDRYLVAPAVAPENTRTVRFPSGAWRDETGQAYAGGATVTFDVPLNRILLFELRQ
ncbi:MAG: glycoside hydrolase family 31 protein [Prevotellaceae bacterium]|jgi:alpha-glucosidase|nr:glycoside hydrolase family 31 protein [Prevotellaceae bacterium]